MKIFWVTFDFADYIWESVEIYANNKREVRKQMKDMYGTNVVIHHIEYEGEI